MTNPSTEAREAAAKIMAEHPNPLCKITCVADIEAIIQSALDSALAAERERRISAEDIVDRSLAHFPEKKLRALAHGHRLKYPKGDDHG